MSLLHAMFESHGMNPIPRGVSFARTQWLLVRFCTPQTHVNSDMAAMSPAPSPVLRYSTGARGGPL